MFIIQESPEFTTTTPLIANGSSCVRKPARLISVLYTKDNNTIFGNSSTVQMALTYTGTHLFN